MIRFAMVTLLACFAMVAGAQDCCGDKGAQGEMSCSKEGASALTTEAAFLAEAQRMALAAENKADECCKSTFEKPMAKGDPGCCNAPGAPAKFKVFVAGHGYKFFGCEDSASKERKQLLASGLRVGTVQKVGKPRTI